MKSRLAVVVSLGTSQTLAWGSSFYLPAMLAAGVARDLGLAPSGIGAARSMALVLSALISPWAGHRIDRLGGRRGLLVSSGLLALALGLLAFAQGPLTLAAAWFVMGLAMGCGRYDTAFAALVRLYRADARKAITGITLLAGFASAVGWPLTALMESLWGPAQVAARPIELGFLSRFSPLLAARLAAPGHPLGASCLLRAGPLAAPAFGLLHGLGNGLLTIVRGSLPLALFGAQRYGARQGWIALPGRLLGALSPWLLGLLLDRHGVAALWLTSAVGPRCG